MTFFFKSDPDIGPPPQITPTQPTPQTNPVKPVLPEIKPDITKVVPTPIIPEIKPVIQPEITP
jgi:hypothetical protein